MVKPILAVMFFALALAPAFADEPKEVQKEAPTPPAAESEPPQPTTDEAIEKVERARKSRQARPIEPSRPADKKDKAAADDKPSAKSPVGSAPSAKRGGGRPYREGDPILARRVRMVRATDGPTKWMLTFDADSSGLGDPPLYLMPCRELEDMEAAAGDADATEFLVTGEVFVYHGQAYFLPRIARPAVNRGNLGQ